MKIVYLCKRHYMGHDVITDRYARLYEQPFQLAQNGNEVLCVCLSYRPCSEEIINISSDKGSLQLLGLSPGSLRLRAFLYPIRLYKVVAKFNPDLIVASSDCLHVILGQWLAARLGKKFAADLYDDYESFELSKIPLVKFLFRRALKKAQAISCVSKTLENHIKNKVSAATIVCALPSTIDKSIFFPRAKNQARNQFSLPEDKKIIGTAGGLTKNKGISTVYSAFVALLKSHPDLHVAVAGPIDPSCPPPHHHRLHYLGKLSHQDVAIFYSALDVGIVYLRNTSYGRFSFPQKAYEMAECKIPMVVASIGDMSDLFSKEENQLYIADNDTSLIRTVEQQLTSPKVANLKIDDWAEHGRKLNQLYEKLIGD